MRKPGIESISEQLTVYSDERVVYGAADAAFRSVGKVKKADADFGRLGGRIRAGRSGMNSATVTVSIETIKPEETVLHITAEAQEGMIYQHTAPGAVSRFLEAFRSRGLPTTPPADANPVEREPTSLGAQLKELGDLRDAGVLTAEEFEAAKSKLLG